MKPFPPSIGQKLFDLIARLIPQMASLRMANKTSIAILFAFLMLGGVRPVYPDTADPAVANSDPAARKLVIEPSAASVPLGNANLIVSPLTHQNGNYVGNYRLRVRPYFFKSERGRLLLATSDDSLRKLQTGTAVNFTGQAVTHEDGRIHIVNGKATPTSADRGSVTFSVVTDDGKLVFNTFYHFEI